MKRFNKSLIFEADEAFRNEDFCSEIEYISEHLFNAAERKEHAAPYISLDDNSWSLRELRKRERLFNEYGIELF